MTSTLETPQLTDPEGSIFLAKDPHVEQFLALEGDPVELVAEILAANRPNTALLLDRLRFSLLQSRGVDRIGSDAAAEEVALEVEKRSLFYEAAQRGTELLASDSPL